MGQIGLGLMDLMMTDLVVWAIRVVAARVMTASAAGTALVLEIVEKKA